MMVVKVASFLLNAVILCWSSWREVTAVWFSDGGSQRFVVGIRIVFGVKRKGGVLAPGIIVLRKSCV